MKDGTYLPSFDAKNTKWMKVVSNSTNPKTRYGLKEVK